MAVFVFGSNLAGRHGKGAALFALQNHGAVYGQGVGRQGDSYAIPTKDAQLSSLPLAEINALSNLRPLWEPENLSLGAIQSAKKRRERREAFHPDF